MQPRDLFPGEYAALGLLAAEPSHGYELHGRWLASPLAEVLPLEQSVLYGYLRTLDQRGLLDWEERRVGNRPPRKIFQPSELGEEFLRAWVRTPVLRLREVRLDFLLKLHVLTLLDPRMRASLVERQIAVCENLRDQARGVAAAEPDSTAFTALFESSRAASAEAALVWLLRYRDANRSQEWAS